MLQHTVSAADRVLRDAFESKVLAPAAFTHEAHVRLAYVYLAELDSKIMLTHYSAAVLFSADARAAFVQPDVDPIPRRAD
jgi:hypothetical protein